MQEVRALQDVGQFTQSIEELREILAVSPDMPEANYRLGAALVQTGDPSRAVWALQKASESSDFAIPAGLLLASTHFAVQDHEEAIRAANRVLEIDPDRLSALQLRAKANLGIHQLDDALADVERLIELQPDDYMSRAIYASVLWDLGRGEEAEEAHRYLKQLGEASEDPALRPRACLAPAMFARDYKKDDEEARALYLECIERYSTNAFLISEVMRFLDSIDDADAATDLIRTSVEKAPENLSLRSTLADRLSSQGDEAGAEAVLVAAADTFGSAAAWNLLASYYRKTRDSEKALAAIDKVIELTGGGAGELRFTQADVLVDLGEYERAKEVVKSLDEPVYATLIRGRIQLAEGDPEAALESFEKGIRHWPNNAGARHLAGVAAYEMGDRERAISELREAIRAQKPFDPARRLLARIQFERGNFQQAANIAKRLGTRPGSVMEPDDHILLIRSLTGARDFEGARKAAAAFGEVPGQEAAAIVEVAQIDTAENGPEAAVATITGSGVDLTDPANSFALLTLIENLLALDRDAEALAKVDAAVAAADGEAEFLALRGRVLMAMARSDEAGAAFDKALELDPENSMSLGGLAVIAGTAGDFAKATELYDRAAEHSERNDPNFAYSAAQLTLQQGDRAGAKERMRAVSRKFPSHAGSRNDLAWMLAEDGEDLDTALSLAQEAQRLDPSPDILDTLGFVHLKRNDGPAAVAAFEKAYAARPDSPYLRMHLGMALAVAGEAERARDLLQSAANTEGFTEAKTAKRELAKLGR
ncbi:MAG: tetratricopeptide repeat protein [Myxococcota bacterium]